MIDDELLTADKNGITVGKDLEVGGKLRLKGDFANVRTYEFTDNQGTKWILDDYGAISTTWDYHIIGLSDVSGSYLVFGLGFYQVNEQGVNGVEVLGLEYYSTAYQEFSYYDGEMTIKTAAYEEDIQPKLYRHILTLNATTEEGSPLVSIIEYLSTNNLKVDSLQGLTTLLHPTANYTYPINVVIDKDLGGIYQDYNCLEYSSNVWKFASSSSLTTKINITSVSDTVAALQ